MTTRELIARLEGQLRRAGVQDADVEVYNLTNSTSDWSQITEVEWEIGQDAPYLRITLE